MMVRVSWHEMRFNLFVARSSLPRERSGQLNAAHLSRSSVTRASGLFAKVADPAAWGEGTSSVEYSVQYETHGSRLKIYLSSVLARVELVS